MRYWASRSAACNGCGSVIRTEIICTYAVACSLVCRVRAGVERKGDDECWPWTHYVETDGYGRFRFNKKRYYAHRAAYELVNGPVPRGMVVMHSCDNPLCCNPAHLSVGTSRDNTIDMDRKGRRVTFRGEETPQAILNEAAVRFIRSSGWKAADLAKHYGVHPNCIYAVLQRRSWKHVTA